MQVALYEFYTGAQINNFQAHSYAVLEYSRNANLTKTLLAPEWDPDRDFPSAGASLRVLLISVCEFLVESLYAQANSQLALEHVLVSPVYSVTA